MEQITQIVNTYIVPIVTYLATSGVLTAVLVAIFKRKIEKHDAKRIIADADVDAKILSAVKAALKSIAGSKIDFDITATVDKVVKEMIGNQQVQNAAILENINAIKQVTTDCALALAQSRSIKADEKERMLANISALQSVKSNVEPEKHITIDVKPQEITEPQKAETENKNAFEVL